MNGSAPGQQSRVEGSSTSFHAGAEGLCCDGVDLRDIAEQVGTPAYVYGARAISESYTAIDEAFTPDSSRYWDAHTYAPGRPQDSFDKQIIRDWLEQSGWSKSPPPPDVPAEVLAKAARRYAEIADRLMR